MAPVLLLPVSQYPTLPHHQQAAPPHSGSRPPHPTGQAAALPHLQQGSQHSTEQAQHLPRVEVYALHRGQHHPVLAVPSDNVQPATQQHGGVVAPGKERWCRKGVSQRRRKSVFVVAADDMASVRQLPLSSLFKDAKK